ncbi:hypothetical protein SPRG_05067 [Saprolegnia parasitica CBS 223.65]|uniref:AAA+ ATPase domain-containing protein n=1 Tax=Saprolegnia parasitica (strain CBS 223.65) TaxID=695850 RepID=A0A067CV06_SAPPC|nr:hypothetical protein SPRG_05067 [Saprolegnia parasitica CBS 223.65]KDO30356.1 hypothetical protein SPRG_05067 [Saprolegnia parasitica CBS 223.65]|eukprot:XP_012198966.1 hypothetical protein SPRG_05067 [Saprolegnia parasitica CBS 223.65]
MKGHADKAGDWREHYGFLNATDKLFLAYPCPTKPRSPNESDKAVDWAITMRPQTASDFLNNENAVEQLSLLSQPVSPKERGQNILILGPPGAGKTSYMQLLLAHLYPVPAERKRYTLSLEADHIDERDLLVKVQTFTRYHEKHTVLVDKYLYIAIENFDRLNPRVQQHTLGPIWDTINTKSIYFILTVTPDASRVTEQIRSSSKCIPLAPLTPLHVLEKVLRICTRERIGYVRSAIESLVARKKAKCIPSVQLLQTLFLSHHYLSVENVRKSLVTKASTEPANRVLSIPEVTFPLRRCTVCTLLPPCKHITLDKMYAKVSHMRALYPQDNQRAVCPDFARTGVCHAFHRRAKCLYDHPLELHDIDTSPLAPRCRVHTLPLPCDHCATLTRSAVEAKALHAQLKSAQASHVKATKELGVVQHRLYLHLKTEATLWGNAKRQFDATTEHLRGLVGAATAHVAQWKDVIHDTTPKVAALDAAIARGFCKGVGKGQAYPVRLAETTV